jgi:hypothetical protein
VVTPSLANPQPTSYGTAKRLRQKITSVPDGVTIVPNNVVMMIVACDECGARFAILHRAPWQDSTLAEAQAVWLKDQFVWDHIQENKHSGSIRLPSSREMKPVQPVPMNPEAGYLKSIK